MDAASKSQERRVLRAWSIQQGSARDNHERVGGTLHERLRPRIEGACVGVNECGLL